jgi:hypothetical protein
MTGTEPAVLEPERIEQMRSAVMDDVEEQERSARRRRRRVRVALAGAAAAVVAVAGVGIGVGTFLGGSSGGYDSMTSEDVAAEKSAGDDAGGEGTTARIDGAVEDSAAPAETTVVTTGSLSAEVDDVEGAVAAVRTFAAARGGRIDGELLEGSGTPYAELSVRVRAGEVESLQRELDERGEVQSVNLERVDVGARVADVQARIDSLEASITRLRSIIGESASTRDLLEAEAQLTRRQADLEGLQAQRRVLRDQTSLATIQVLLHAPDSARAVEADGFTGGLTRGWNALVDTMNAVVEGAGFLVPWLVPLAVAGAVVAAVNRRRHAR